MNLTKPILNYALKNRKQALLLSFLIFSLVLLLIIVTQWIEGKSFFLVSNWVPGLKWWTEWLDPFIGVGVFLIAFNVWLSELRQEWSEQLEKRLTVLFYFENKELFRCEEAFLSNEGDIRSWSQQIGRQMANGQLLMFEPFIDVAPLSIEFDYTKKAYFRHYKTKIFLIEKPKTLGLGENELKRYNHTIQEIQQEILVWRRKA